MAIVVILIIVAIVTIFFIYRLSINFHSGFPGPFTMYMTVGLYRYSNFSYNESSGLLSAQLTQNTGMSLENVTFYFINENQQNQVAPGDIPSLAWFYSSVLENWNNEGSVNVIIPLNVHGLFSPLDRLYLV